MVYFISSWIQLSHWIWWIMLLSIFHMLADHLCIFFYEVSIQFFSNWTICLLLHCKNTSYILALNLLLDTNIVNTFFHFVICLFIFFMVSFRKQAVIMLMKSNLSCIMMSTLLCPLSLRSLCSSQSSKSFLLYLPLEVS